MRRASVSLLLSLVLGGSTSCRPPAEQQRAQSKPQVDAPNEVLAPDGRAPEAAAAQAGCSASEERCAADDVAVLCEGGRLVEKKCAAGTTCLGTSCLPLRTDDGRLIDPQTLLVPREEGWFNAWTAVGPVTGPLPESTGTFDADAGVDALRKPLCAKDGRVEVHDKTDGKKGSRGVSHYVLSGFVVANESAPVVFATGFAGTVRMSLDGKRFLGGTREADPPPFRDEMRATVDVEKGVHRLVVEVEQPTNAPTSFWLRARSPAGGPAPNLFFATDSQATCSATDLLRLNVASRPVAEGFALEVRPSWIGMGPREIGDLPYRVEIDLKKNGQKVLAEGTLPKADLGSSKANITSTVPLETGGTHEVRVRLGNAPGTVIATPLVIRANLHRRIMALAGKRDFIEQSKATRGEKDSLLFHVEDLLHDLSRGDPDTSWIKMRTEEAEQLVGALEQGKSPYAERAGVLRRAYRSPLDGQLQPYTLFVPRAYKPGGKPLPLVLAAHGLGNRPEIALRVVVGEAPEGGFQGSHEARHLPGLPDLGAFIVAPWQFGNAGQRHLGEADALQVIEEVRAHYPINPQRISITGYSLGGTISFYLPLHYPDLFSSSAPLCGYPNLLDWSSIRTPPHKPWENVLLAKRYIVNWAENGLHVPLFMVHGGKDEPRRSEVMAKRYQALGYAHELDVQEDLDHNVWDYGYEDGDMIRRLIGRKRPDVPDRVRFVTGEWRYDRAYWVRVLGLASGDKFADIDARFTKSDGSVVVQAKNVESFALDLKQLPLKKEPRVTVNGKPMTGPFAAETAYFVQQGGEFVRVNAEPSRAGKKRAGVSGPLDDIDRHGRLIVYGTGDPAQTEENRLVAEHFASFDTFAARFPIKSDVEITDAEIDARSLVLIGNPKSNRVTALFEAALPVKFEPQALTFRGKRHEGADVGISFIYPHPRNAQEYVVVHAGVGVPGTLASRHIPRFAPDFLVYDARMTVQRGGHLLDQRQVRDGGFFDADWK